MRRHFARYYVNHNGNAVEALGTDSVTAPMDGRWSLKTCHEYAANARPYRPDYIGYRLFFGDRYTNAQCVSGFRPLKHNNNNSTEEE